MAKALNLKNMKETYIQENCDHKMWTMFWEMTCLGYIDNAIWNKFQEQCEGWEYDCVQDAVIDRLTGNVVKQW